MAAFKGSGRVFYTPEKHVNCVEEYYQQDVSFLILRLGRCDGCREGKVEVGEMRNIADFVVVASD